MKKLLIKTILIWITILVMMSSCEKDVIMFNSSMNIVGFSSAPTTIIENLEGSASVLVYLGAMEGTSPVTITLTTDTTGFGVNGAVEGTDFTLSTMSLEVGVGESAIEITPVDNDIFTGDKKFYLVITSNSGNYSNSAQSRLLITISDDEHPLKSWIGTYSVDASSYGLPGDWDEAWTVITAPVEGDVTSLTLTGIGSDTADPIIAVFNTGDMTITIDPGQSLGDCYGAGPVSVFEGTVDLEFNENNPLVGTIQNDGTILVDFWGHNVTEGPYQGAWDVFNTTWTKN